jgi:hypothetical protein
MSKASHLSRATDGFAAAGVVVFVCSTMACSSTNENLSISFPDAASQSLTRELVITAFQPLRVDAATGELEFAPCSRMGRSPARRRYDPTLANFPFAKVGEPQVESYPLPSEWNYSLQKVPEANDTNPWGAVMFYVDARGSGDPGDPSETLLEGCSCARSTSSQALGKELSDKVEAACPLFGRSSSGLPIPTRSIDLEPIVDGPFSVEACEVNALTVPRGQAASPGPEMCVRVSRCSSNGPEPCFDCGDDCGDPFDLSNVPIVVELVDSDGQSTPARQVIRSDASGRARGRLTVGDCNTSMKLSAQVVGRSAIEADVDIRCVDPISNFRCAQDLVLTRDASVVASTSVPGVAGRNDGLAVVYASENQIFLEVVNPLVPRVCGADADCIQSEGETCLPFTNRCGLKVPDATRSWAARGFTLDGDRSMVVLVVSGTSLFPPDVRVYEWTPQGPGALRDVSNGRFAASCDKDEFMCLASGLCRLQVGDIQGEAANISIDVADVNADGTNDIVMTTDYAESGGSSVFPVATFFGQGGNPSQAFSRDECVCGTFGQLASGMSVPQFGGQGEDPDRRARDLVLIKDTGMFLSYGSVVDTVIQGPTCGSATSLLGGFTPVDDVGRGYFRCDPLALIDATACFEDVAFVSNNPDRDVTSSGRPISVLFGSERSLNPRVLASTPGLRLVLNSAKANLPEIRKLEVGDVNGDRMDDLAILFGDEVRVWLGAQNGALGESTPGAVLTACDGAINTPTCSILGQRFHLSDLNGDEREDIVAVCQSSTDGRLVLRWYQPEVSR